METPAYREPEGPRGWGERRGKILQSLLRVAEVPETSYVWGQGVECLAD